MCDYVAKAGRERRQYRIILTWESILVSIVENGNWRLWGWSVYGAGALFYIIFSCVRGTKTFLLLHWKILECSPCLVIGASESVLVAHLSVDTCGTRVSVFHIKPARETYHVYLKIQPMSYFHQGNNMSVCRNLNTLPQKRDIEGVFGRIFTT